NDNHIKHNNTTPDISILYKYFNIAYKNNIKYIVMELSSIGVSELRIRYIPFNILVFTNFSEDHLDYHINMDRYLFNKCIPFYQLDNNSYSIVNIDDSNYEEIIKHSYSNVITYSIINDSDYKATDLNILNSGITFKINNIEYKSNLLGRFNIYNLLPLFPISKILNLTNLKLFMNDLKIQGRMNLIKIDNKNIIIDYAHTPEAVKSVIQEVLRIASGRIFVIVGCGGNREREKRRIIGNILKSYNIIPIITTDNPRYEDPLDIINDINIDNSFTVVADRKKAIIYGINNMKDNDYLLILGKGCEDYMEIKGRKIPYSDYMVIEEYINGN
ncbi:MAG: UDP-N-acetylmuramyl-tripeptide synthetase, partial [Acholeplasmatales bacterium]|nr:UDP-N-acetylmuramyl-tripeptide synthetase [Acholeplasmatales bacterium]